MQKIAIFIREAETNKLSLHIDEVNVELAIERYGSVSKYIKFTYTGKNPHFIYFDELRITL